MGWQWRQWQCLCASPGTPHQPGQANPGQPRPRRTLQVEQAQQGQQAGVGRGVGAQHKLGGLLQLVAFQHIDFVVKVFVRLAQLQRERVAGLQGGEAGVWGGEPRSRQRAGAGSERAACTAAAHPAGSCRAGSKHHKGSRRHKASPTWLASGSSTP